MALVSTGAILIPPGMTGNQRLQDPNYLLKKQYRCADNLAARISLHERFSTNPLGLHRWVLQQVRGLLPANAALLEVGCGEGRLWSVDPAGVPPGWQLTLTDFSAGMLASAEDRLAPLYSERVRFRVADVQALPFLDEAFEAVFAHFMLHHIPRPEKALAEISRVLKPGGWFFTSTFGKNHMQQIYEYAMRFEGQPDRANWEIPFRLDNGTRVLAPFFEDIRLLEYADGLRVSEVEPVAAYVLSMTDPAHHRPDRIAALNTEIAADMEARGELEIDKESGMFACRKPEAAA